MAMSTRGMLEEGKTTARLDERHVAVVNGCFGRKEICIINAVIVGSKYDGGPKGSYKPIVVDIDLPVAEYYGTQDHSDAPTSIVAQPNRPNKREYVPRSSSSSMGTSAAVYPQHSSDAQSENSP